MNALPLACQYAPSLTSSSLPSSILLLSNSSILPPPSNILQLQSPAVYTFIVALNPQRTIPIEKPRWTLPCPPVPLCPRSTVCTDCTIKKQPSKEIWNEKLWLAVACRREMNASTNSQQARPLSNNPGPAHAHVHVSSFLSQPISPHTATIAPVFKIQHTQKAEQKALTRLCDPHCSTAFHMSKSVC